MSATEIKGGPVADAAAGKSDPTAPAPARRLLNTVRVRERRDVHSMLELDPTTVDPTRHYRFVRRDSLAMTKAQLKGYDVEKTGEGGPKLLGQHDDAADGTINIADVVLMSCPKELYEQGRAQLARRNEEMLEVADTEARDKINEKGKIGGRQAIRVISDKE